MSLLFTVEDRFTTGKGLAIVGYAPHPETPLPNEGELVEVHNPDGSTFRVEVIDVDVEFSTRACFTEKTVNRAMLIGQNEPVEVLVGAEIRRLTEAQI
ncbi:MAG TPA: hypothetical protein VE980_15385 [Pyrinomonadaceae bacterium]|nr:hypothetical protein [Pyrinomonadaceae bacterium]